MEVAGTVFISQPERDESDVSPAKEVSDTMMDGTGSTTGDMRLIVDAEALVTAATVMTF
jgi:hypothetical protein